MLTDRLADFPFAQRLDVAARAALAAEMRVEHVPAGTRVSERGRTADSVFLVLEGEFLGGIAALGGREVLIDALGPGRLFGELAALDGGARVRSVRAAVDGRIAAVKAAPFEAWLAAHPAAMRALLAELAGQMRALADRLYEMAMHDVETRVRLHLVRAFIDAGVLEPGGRLDPMPDYGRVGAFVGATGAEVALAMARFEAARMVARDGPALILLDPPGLEHGL